MTRHFGHRQAVVFSLFVAVFITLTTSVARAQQGDGDASKTPAVFLSRDHSVSMQVPAGVSEYEIGNAAPLRGKKISFGAQDGTPPVFQSLVAYDSGGGDGRAVAVADVDGDGHLDIVVVNSCPSAVANCENMPQTTVDGTVGVLLGNGDGTFRTVVAYDAGGSFPSSVAIQDVNGDGKPDLVVINECTDGSTCSYMSAAVLLGNGNGTFQSAVSYKIAGLRQESFDYVASPSIVIEDVNNDGKPDVIVSGVCDVATDCADGGVAVMLGNGDGSFQTAVVYDAGGQWTSSLALGDLNGDGQPDIVLTNCGPTSGGGCGGEGSVGVLLGNGDGTFRAAVLYDSGGVGTMSLAVGDVNGDGKLDVVASSIYAAGGSGACGTEFAGVLLGNGDGTLATAGGTSPEGCLPASTVIADVNGDGTPDLVVSSCGPWIGCSLGFANVLVGNSDGSFGELTTFASGYDTFSLFVADVNGDGEPDIIAGDPFSASGSDGTVGVLVNDTPASRATTATTVSSSLNPSSYGHPVTFSAEVTSSGGTPTGRLFFYDGSFLLNSAPLVNGSASFTTSALASYSHPITAAYQGSGDFATSTSTALYEVVTGSSSTTSLATSPNPSTYGQTITLTATVSSASGTPGGVVVFHDGATSLGGATLAGGIAKLPNATLTVGSHTITAAYLGAGAFEGSASAGARQIVNIATTATAVASSENPARKGQKVTYTATVTGQFDGMATGTVMFKDGGVTIATVNVSGNQAAYTTSYAAPGVHPITAAYSGDANNSGSTSPALYEVVGKAPFATTTTVTTSGSPSHVGQPVTFTATVTSKDGAIPDGETVQFFDGSAQIGSGVTSGGVASFTTSSLTKKKHTIKVEYPGDGDFKASKGTVIQVVEQ